MKINYKTDRVYIKEVQIEELNDSVMLWFNDKELMKYYTNSGNQITREALLNSINEGKRLNNNFTYGIYDISTNNIIGTIKIGPINLKHNISDLVVLIGDRNYLGKGLSKEIISLGNNIAFKEHNIRKLYGGMYLSNISSIKAYRSAGWIVEGRLKGFYFENNQNEDRLLVTCLNPDYFSKEEIDKLKENEYKYL